MNLFVSKLIFLSSVFLGGTDLFFNAVEEKSFRSYCNPLNIPLADPFVLFHDGTYYLYGTCGISPNEGLPVWTSKDLVHWQNRGHAFQKTPDTWSQSHFWGPEILFVKGKFLMYFNASPNKDSKQHPPNMHLCIAEGPSPLGPFTELKAPFYKPPGGKEAIDQHIFIDDDGSAYAYITIVMLGRNEIQAVKLEDNMIEFDGEPVECIRPTQAWEIRPWGKHVVAEGAFVLKHKGFYYLTYTGNHYKDPNYAIGYAVGKNPLGPWEKFEGNPILAKTDYIHGPGNGMVVPSPDGKELFLVYHVHNSITEIYPRRPAIDRIRFAEQARGPDQIVVEGPTHTPQPLPGSESQWRKK